MPSIARPQARFTGLALTVAVATVATSLVASRVLAQGPCTPATTAPGSLDTCFGVDGSVTLDVTGGAEFQTPTSVVVLPDGGLNSIAIDASGRILGVGRADLASSANASTQLWIARYTSSGALDSSFGTGGNVLLDVNGTIDIANALALQGDGRLVVGGDAEMTDYSFSHGVVARLNVNGSLDDGTATDATIGDSFGTNGMRLIDFLASTDYLRGVALQSDDDGAKFIVASALNGSRLIALTRYFQ